MIKPGEIQQIANRLVLRDTQIEKDYVIGWVLRGISENNYLNSNLAFKGGTALRKAYFPDYRLSEDLDFTALDKIETTKFNENIQSVNNWIYEESRIKLDIEDETEHQTGNFNFYLSYTGPLGGSGKNIKVDISCDEVICEQPKHIEILNEYSDLQDKYQLLVYPLSEIIAEKMRSVMQRTMPRDLYDLWYLFEMERLNIEDYVLDFLKKAEHKGYDGKKFVNTVSNKQARFKKAWEENLSNQMREIPGFDDVWRELSKHWRRYTKAIE